MRRPRNAIPFHHPDQAANRDFSSLRDRTRDLEERVERTEVIRSVELPDATAVDVSHTLGLDPFIQVSPVRGAIISSGRIEDVTPGSTNRAKRITLMALGFGAPVTVDVKLTA